MKNGKNAQERPRQVHGCALGFWNETSKCLCTEMREGDGYDTSSRRTTKLLYILVPSLRAAQHLTLEHQLAMCEGRGMCNPIVGPQTVVQASTSACRILGNTNTSYQASRPDTNNVGGELFRGFRAAGGVGVVLRG
jgi:hypothetical protein